MENRYDDDQQPFLSSSSDDNTLASEKALNPEAGKSVVRRHFRVILDIFMGCLIVFLSAHYFIDGTWKKVPSSAVPTFPRKTYVFEENKRYLHEEMFVSQQETLHTLHNWIELSADGRGYVKVDKAEGFDLGEPYQMQVNETYSEPVYMMSVFHQLHCLSYLVQHFQNGYEGNNLTEEVAHHSAHCFDNIRQTIMCGADTSLEGKTETPGWGAKHECKDYDKVLEWANSHDVYKWRTRLMPIEAVL